uniref:Sad1 and UNC84 domain containing 1 n=1 Tax=Podarcis muralis TaxID=64176 RepID=A0A670KGB8_PODMU
MDFSRLHTYTPPQCVPENTGYTYALSSSYSSTALDFETEHKLDPVFDSPRMSRRSLRLSAVTYNTPEDSHNEGIFGDGSGSYGGKKAFADQSTKFVKQRKSVVKQSGSVRHTPRKSVPSSSSFSHSSFSSHASDGSLMSTILDESSIQEQTAVDHFWGLDDDGDLKGGDTTVVQGNGDLATAENQTTLSNGYTCSDCSMLSERKEVLTAYSAARMPSSRIYSRDRRGLPFYTNQILRAAKYTTTSFSSLIVQLFQMILLKLGYDCKGISFFSLSFSLSIHGHLGDDCKGKKHLETHTTAHMQSSRSKRVARTIWHIFSYTGYFLLHMLQRMGTAGWFVSRKIMSLLWLAVVSPGKAAAGVFWWLGTGWYQLVTLISLLNVFLLTRFETMKVFDADRVIELEKKMAFMSKRWHHRDEEYSKMLLLLQSLQDQVTQMNDKSEMLTLIKNVVGQHIKEMKPDETLHPARDFLTLHQEHEWRIVALEDLLAKLSEKSEVMKRVIDFKSFFHDITCLKESVKIMLFGNQQGDLPESLLQWLTSKFVSKSDLQNLLQDLELQILKNITLHMSVANTKSTSEVVTSVVNEAGISGITEAQARIIVNNALKLFSQDKTGMVDFALESGGGSILSTRCSETYETKTALISLFGIPLWYFSQSPRVVIQPDMYPGNCWAFKGSQGYLVVRLSMMIYPTAFTLEHIPKTLSPTGNITSAPKDFSVYGLESEYEQEGVLLGQYIYDQDGEPLQMFQTTEKPFQIVELRIFSNWGHTEYTCLYRFRVHGRPAE